MAKSILPIVFGIMFIFGWFCSGAYSSVVSHISLPGSADESADVADPSGTAFERYFFNNRDISSPSDWVDQEQIHVYKDKVVIDLESPQWAVFTDTNSMDPVIDAGAHAIEVVPASEDEVVVGDIVSYKSDYADGTVIHRVIEVGNDVDGWYCRAKGDNNPFEDPGKIRFSQIQRVLVAIIY